MGCCFSRSPDCLYTDLSLQLWDRVKARFDEEEEFGPFDVNQLFPLTMDLDPPLRLNQNGDTVLTMTMHYIHPLYFCNEKIVGHSRFFGQKKDDFLKEPIEFTRKIFEAQENDARNLAAEKSVVTGCYPLHYAFKLVDLELVKKIRDAFPDALKVKCERDPLDKYDVLDFQEVLPAQATPYELALFYGHRYQEWRENVEHLLELLDYEGNPYTDDNGTPLVKPRVDETLQHLIEHQAYEAAKSVLNYTTTGLGREDLRFHFVRSNMVKSDASEERMDLIHHVDIQGRTPLHCCFRSGMTQYDCELAHLILDISNTDDVVGYRDGLWNICHFKDARGLYPISLAAMYCEDDELIKRIISKNPRAIEEKTGKPFELTPYEHMRDSLNEGHRSGWDDDRKFHMLGLLDFESNTSRWEQPIMEEVVDNVPEESPEDGGAEEGNGDPEDNIEEAAADPELL